jgi:hypothetical protein
VEQAHCINLDTMAMEPAEAAQHQILQAGALVPCLRLSEQQQELISVAMSIYYELLASIHRERQEIDIQMTAVGQHSSSRDASMAGASSSSSSSRQVDSLPKRQQQLHAHQELTNRLNLLLHKEVGGWWSLSIEHGKCSREGRWSVCRASPPCSDVGMTCSLLAAELHTCAGVSG